MVRVVFVSGYCLMILLMDRAEYFWLSGSYWDGHCKTYHLVLPGLIRCPGICVQL